jgi:hypothetical protein
MQQAGQHDEHREAAVALQRAILDAEQLPAASASATSPPPGH